ncbi:hypothetical protein [Microbacterium sp. No. 7]|uniref:hypothetical protein n=1 Tax=Microbacterium sp. No. 7 TaxID=1714373 RepID=UPI0006D0A0C7|nr:hypothetical protein [Microbacterium sp. No. 7]ALJ20523.1 hypothetical protein AOA12_11660 [Microbacterium sp. No. 7]
MAGEVLVRSQSLCIGRFPALCAAVVILVFGLVGCSATERASVDGTIADSLQDLFEQSLRDDSLTDFERDVLTGATESGRIKQSEYLMGIDLYLDCMSDQGYTISTAQFVSGAVELKPPLVDDVDALMRADMDCMAATAGNVIMLFEIQQGNPHLYADPARVAYACLESAGLAGGDVTVDATRGFLERGMRSNPPFDVQDPQVKSCFYGAGMNYDIIEDE